MMMNEIKGTQFCMNCKYCDARGNCDNIHAEKVWFSNQANGCDYFDGELDMIDWDKATPVGYRPSTFSR